MTGVMSTPIPSPSMNGMIGLLGTVSTPLSMVILMVWYFVFFRIRAWVSRYAGSCCRWACWSSTCGRAAADHQSRPADHPYRGHRRAHRLGLSAPNAGGGLRGLRFTPGAGVRVRSPFGARMSARIARYMAGRGDPERAAWRAGDVAAWVDESHALARREAYGALPGWYCGAATPAAPTPLDEVYLARARARVPQQLVKAAVRLAEVLNRTLR